MNVDIPKTINELRRWIKEFRISPFKSSKALIILAIFAVSIITQWSGYVSNTAYGWMIFGMVIIFVILIAALKIAYYFDEKES